MKNKGSAYRMRGNKVPYLSDEQVLDTAEVAAGMLGLTPSLNLERIEDLFDLWELQFGLVIDVVDDDEWGFFTNGHFDPAELTIRFPQRVLNDIKSSVRKKRLNGLRVLFHELGHFALSHRAVLHDDKTPPCKEIDAEEQADLFAACVSQIISREEKQLRFLF